MKQQLATLRENLNILDAFAEAHPIGIPEQMITCYGFSRSISIQIQYAPNQAGRDKVLAAVGDALGRDGWTKRRDRNYPDRWNFSREIDGIKVEIEGAEINRMEDTPIPVPPSAFPLMIEDSPAAGIEDEIPF